MDNTFRLYGIETMYGKSGETVSINPTASTLMSIAHVMDIRVGEFLDFKLDKLDFEK